MELLNYETPGSERAQINDLINTLPVIVNEDYCMLVRVSSADDGAGGVYPVNTYSDGYPCIVKGEKIWDLGDTKKEFYFILLYAGRADYPGPKTVTYNQVIPIYRVGEYDSKGTYGFELHEENQNKISWVAFVNVPQMILVQVIGSQATPVVYENGAWVVKGTAKTAIPLGTNFYGSPLVSESKYLAYETTNAYMIELRGYGSKATTLTASLNQLRVSVDVDPTGKVLAITAAELT